MPTEIVPRTVEVSEKFTEKKDDTSVEKKPQTEAKAYGKKFIEDTLNQALTTSTNIFSNYYWITDEKSLLGRSIMYLPDTNLTDEGGRDERNMVKKRHVTAAVASLVLIYGLLGTLYVVEKVTQN